MKYSDTHYMYTFPSVCVSSRTLYNIQHRNAYSYYTKKNKANSCMHAYRVYYGIMHTHTYTQTHVTQVLHLCNVHYTYNTHMQTYNIKNHDVNCITCLPHYIL